MFKPIFTLFLLFCLTVSGQDTIRIMHYNLLMYGNDFSGCNSSNNNVFDKNGYLRTIINYVQPDIVTVNEIYKDPYYHDLILDEVFNIEGINYFARAYPPNLSNGYSINQVFYNTQLFTLESNSAVATSVRDIDIFTFSYISSNAINDPVLNCVVAHLKAGDEDEDEVERDNETMALMDYLNNNNASGNYAMLGDLNVYTAAEQAFQNLLFYSNEDIRFNDPILKIGSWHNNDSFANEHTQSTHTSGDCPSVGGMDDRFDFILLSEEIIDGTNKMQYINNSYKAIGQDGLHFNKSLLDLPDNNSVPADVLSALYNMSDHLPVVIDLVVSDDLGFHNPSFQQFNLSLINPVRDNLIVTFNKVPHVEVLLELINLNGHKFYSKRADKIANKISIPVSNLVSGLYFLKISDQVGTYFPSKNSQILSCFLKFK